MKKYKVLKPFIDRKTLKGLLVGDVIELTDERHAEMQETFDKLGEQYLELVKPATKKTKE